MVLQKILHKVDIKIDGAIGKCYASRGAVYCGRHIKNGRNLVVRAVSINRLKQADLDELRNEVAILNSLNHDLIMKPTGLCSDFLYCSISPLMDLGSIDRVITHHYPTGLTEKVIGSVLYQMTKALGYVHKRRIIHRAIKASHILCNREGHIKLTGFRHAIYVGFGEGNRWLDDDEISYGLDPQLNGSLYWAAPELLAQNLYGYSYKSDIFSLGATVCEMGNGYCPFSDFDPLEMLRMKLQGTVPVLLDDVTIPQPESTEADNDFDKLYRAKHYSANLHNLLSMMLDLDPVQRISLSEICESNFIKVLTEKKVCKIFTKKIPLPTFTTALSSARSVSPYPVDFPELNEAAEDETLGFERYEERYDEPIWDYTEPAILDVPEHALAVIGGHPVILEEFRKEQERDAAAAEAAAAELEAAAERARAAYYADFANANRDPNEMPGLVEPADDPIFADFDDDPIFAYSDDDPISADSDDDPIHFGPPHVVEADPDDAPIHFGQPHVAERDESRGPAQKKHKPERDSSSETDLKTEPMADNKSEPQERSMETEPAGNSGHIM